jgi:broad specificity phosphatase PhoE
LSTQFALVRHATCAQMDEVLLGRVVDSPLNINGEHQATLLAERLNARNRPALIATSPRLRTRQTAEHLVNRAMCAVEIHSELDEVDFGRWSSRRFSDLEGDSEWREWNAHRNSARTPAGDTIAAVQDRALRCLQTLAQRFSEQSIVIVSHSEVIRSILLRCLGLPASAYMRLRIDPASVSSLEWNGEFVAVVSVNERLI